MRIIKKPNKIDYLIFKKRINNPQVKYGLPEDINYCKKCVQSNQRPTSTVEFTNSIKEQKKTLHFNKDGICDACSFAEQKKRN